MPAQKREGHIAVYGVKLGATHGQLDEIISNSENAKVKRSMYAETVREKAELVEGIRSSDWNEDMDPTIAAVQSGKGCYDFSKGYALSTSSYCLSPPDSCLCCCKYRPCHVPVNVILRNHSPLYEARVTFRLHSGFQSQPQDSYVLSLPIHVCDQMFKIIPGQRLLHPHNIPGD